MFFLYLSTLSYVHVHVSVLVINSELCSASTAETFCVLFVCGRTSTNKSGTLASDLKNCAAAEDSGMPCPVPIQPHRAKVLTFLMSSHFCLLRLQLFLKFF